MTAKMDLTYPKMTTDPSDLLKSSYQEKIHRLIKKYTKQDALDQLSVHLKEQLPLKQSKLASKIQSSANTRSIVNEVLRTVLEQAPKSADPEVLKVKKIVIEQKRLEKEVKNILRESKHPSHVNDLKEKIKATYRQYKNQIKSSEAPTDNSFFCGRIDSSNSSQESSFTAARYS
ncbi:hypothetical protein FSP39_021604 [Pinctada imbricata]|uniref:Uncharacterized protein n=1 Tax=Pinctada imbricata TaxID=66713 RepID=A0AA88Y0K7_PINIB|nr:hypothetical protein FSP39_021604 [Pinctada imbricata]